MEVAYNFITSKYLFIAFIAFIIFSYILLGLLTRSFNKPLKYLGYPTVIVGLINFGVDLSFNYLYKVIPEAELIFLKPFFISCQKIFLRFGIICSIVGVVILIIYYVINKILKNKSKDISVSDNLTQETEQ